MHDQRIGASALDGLREIFQRLFRVLIVDPDAAFDGDRDRNRGLHRRDAIADEIWLRHQTRAEAAFLHAVGRAAHVQIDFIETRVRADPCTLGQRARLRAAKLQSQRMLRGMEAEKPRAIAMQHRAGGEHFGIEQRAARQQAMEEPAMPVGPFHHRRD